MNSVAHLTTDILAGSYQNHYSNLWRKYADLALQKVGAQMGAALLKTSGLPDAILKDIWDISDYNKAGSLDQKGFFVALHLVALGQSNKVPLIANISQQTPSPRFADLTDNMPPGDWSESERKFQELPLQEGFLSGNSVKPMMLASGLPPATLARIWQMVDTDSDGKLRVNEFCVALFLIKQCTGKLIMCIMCPLNTSLSLSLSLSLSSGTAAPPEPPLLPLHPTLFPTVRSPGTRRTGTPASGRVLSVADRQEEVRRHLQAVRQNRRFYNRF